LPNFWSPKLFIRVLKSAIDTAIERHLTLSLWFHPCLPQQNLTEVWPAVLEYAATKQDKLWLGTMGQLANWATNQPAFSATPDPAALPWQ